MDIQELVKMFIGNTAENPDLLSSLMEHPYSTIGNMTDNNNVSSEEASQVVTAMSALASGQNVDFSNLASMASQLLAGSGGSVHSLAESLLGSGAQAGVDVSNGVSTNILENLAGAVFSGKSAGIDLSDGIGIDDILGIAGMFLGKR